MGFATMHSQCAACTTMISFHANHVPSLTIDGSRRAICRDCFERWNQIHRIDEGLDPIPLHPDAYSPMDETVLQLNTSKETEQ